MIFKSSFHIIVESDGLILPCSILSLKNKSFNSSILVISLTFKSILIFKLILLNNSDFIKSNKIDSLLNKFFVLNPV